MASVVQTERLQTTGGDSSSAPIVAAASDDGLVLTDVLRDILLRLPAKPLCRLRAVCRSWRSLLSDSWFAAAHEARQQPLVAVYKHDYGVESQDIQILDTSGHVVRQMRVENCLIMDYRSYDVYTNLNLLCLKGRDQRLRVLDPATGAVSLLPGHVVDNCVPYEYADCSTTYAVGRDGSTGETKVLAITQDLAYTFCSVLTLGDSGGWRETGYPPTSAISSWYTAVVKGVLYLLFFQKIAAFDFDKEKWRPDLVNLPLPVERQHFLAELSGTLVASDHHSDTSMDLWFLTDPDKGSWSKQYTITMTPYQQASSSLHAWTTVRPFWLLDDGRIAFWVWQGQAYGEKRVEFIRVYDPTTHTYTDGDEMTTYSFHAVFKGSLLRSSLDKKLSMYPAIV